MDFKFKQRKSMQELVVIQILGKYSGARDSHNNKYIQQISIIASNSAFTYNRSIHFRATNQLSIMVIKCRSQALIINQPIISQVIQLRLLTVVLKP